MSAEPWLLAAAACLALLLVVLRAASGARRAVVGAPRVPGLPALGHALALGRWGVAFITACRAMHGPSDALCINVGLGQRMLFLVRAWAPCTRA